MRMVDIIEKKRDGHNLSDEEIEFVIRNYSTGNIPDYQMSALLMAIYYNGMDKKESTKLTIEALNSGQTIDLGKIEGIKVDKHSTGGVGDKVTLVVGPLVASMGIPFAKMSGRGLGYTGGTLDKLQAIEGYNIKVELEDFYRQVNEIKIAIIGQSANLTPADKKMYALRDVTATVDSIPLIAASIMSKKLASGADKIVLDVKVGTGAFMKNKIDASVLANMMVEIGKNLGKETVAYITDMNQPLGNNIGNLLEVKEAIETLKGEGPEDLLEVSLTLASELVIMAGVAPDHKEAKKMLLKKIQSGEAFDKFKQLVKYQGGKVKLVDNLDLMPQAREILPIYLEAEGYVSSLNALNIGKAAMILGAGREKKDDAIDPVVGIVLNRKIGDKVASNTPVAFLHINDENNKEEAIQLVKLAYVISRKRPKPLKIIHSVIK